MYIETIRDFALHLPEVEESLPFGSENHLFGMFHNSSVPPSARCFPCFINERNSTAQPTSLEDAVVHEMACLPSVQRAFNWFSEF